MGKKSKRSLAAITSNVDDTEPRMNVNINIKSGDRSQLTYETDKPATDDESSSSDSEVMDKPLNKAHLESRNSQDDEQIIQNAVEGITMNVVSNLIPDTAKQPLLQPKTVIKKHTKSKQIVSNKPVIHSTDDVRRPIVYEPPKKQHKNKTKKHSFYYSDSEYGSISDNSDDTPELYEMTAIDNLDIAKQLIQNKPYNKINYTQMEEKISKYYFSKYDYYSSALDILASYLKGQKYIYMEAKYYCEQRQNRLMMPAIFITAVASVLALSIDEYTWGGNMIASINAFCVFLLTLISYLKLDCSSEAHKITSHQYDKLQTKCEFWSGEVLLFGTEIKDGKSLETRMHEHLEEIEKKIGDIKDSNRFIVPREIRYRFSVIYNTNIFAIVKKIENQRKKMITNLKNIDNEIRFYKRLQIHDGDNFNKMNEYMRVLDKLFIDKKQCTQDILILSTSFSIIDQMFKQEIDNDHLKKKRWLPNWLYSEPIVNPEKMNDFIYNLLYPFRNTKFARDYWDDTRKSVHGVVTNLVENYDGRMSTGGANVGKHPQPTHYELALPSCNSLLACWPFSCIAKPQDPPADNRV